MVIGSPGDAEGIHGAFENDKGTGSPMEFAEAGGHFRVIFRRGIGACEL
jgi:hypothetical protein